MRRALLVLCSVTALLATVSLACPSQDTIVKMDGSTLPKPGGRPIRVMKETLSDIEYKMEGLPTMLKIATREVAGIKYARTPEAYKVAEESFQNNEFADAIQDYEQALATGRGYHWLEQNALYKIALCLMKIGDNTEAVKAFQTLLAKVPDTRFFAPAWTGKLRCLLLARGVKGENEIEKAMREFERAIRKHRLGKFWSFEVDYLRLRLRDAKGEDITDDAEALSKAAEGINPGVASKAKILIGHNLLAKDPAKARDYFERVLKSAGKNQHGVKAAAYTGLGICLFRIGTGDKIKGYRRARDLFLRAIVLSDNFPDQVEREVTVRALYYGGRCFAILKREGPHNRRHARILLREVVDKYPGSPWAARASDELKKL